MRASSHLARDCKKRLKCNICRRWHATVLHREWKGPQQPSVTPVTTVSASDGKKPETNGERAEAKENVKCGLTNFGMSPTESLPGVVPVVVKSRKTGRQTTTYAFLDSGSNAVFCAEEVVARLAEKGKVVNIQV